MALNDFVVAVRPEDKAPVTAVPKTNKDEFLEYHPSIEFKDIAEYVISRTLSER